MKAAAESLRVIVSIVAIVAAICITWRTQEYFALRRARAIIAHPDNNPELTRMARTALPIINQTADYIRKNGAAPTAGQLRELVKDPRLQPGDGGNFGDSVVPSGSADAWIYTSFPNENNRDRKGFILCRMITHYTAFGYDYDGTEGKWKLIGEAGRDEVHLNL